LWQVVRQGRGFSCHKIRGTRQRKIQTSLVRKINYKIKNQLLYHYFFVFYDDWEICTMLQQFYFYQIVFVDIRTSFLTGSSIPERAFSYPGYIYKISRCLAISRHQTCMIFYEFPFIHFNMCQLVFTVIYYSIYITLCNF